MKIGEESGIEIMVSQEAYEEMQKEKMIEENKILKELQERNEKAIEYIKENEDYFNNYPLINRNELLNILQGSDKDE